MRIHFLLHFSLFQSVFVLVSLLSIVIFTDREFSKDSFFVRSNSNDSNDEVPWILVGGLRSDEATFRIRIDWKSDAQFFVAKTTNNLGFAQIIYSSSLTSIETSSTVHLYVHSITVTELDPHTSYIYGILSSEWIINNTSLTPNIPKYGSFTTPKQEGSRFNFTVAVSGCALTGSKTHVFRHIIDNGPHVPLLFLHSGDFHYEDLNTLFLEDRIEAIDQVMASPTQRYMLANMPLVYMWDDHDFLGNNALAFQSIHNTNPNTNTNTNNNHPSTERDIALQSYHQAFPVHQPLPASLFASNDMDTTNTVNITPPYHAFSIGTVRFIVTDLRSESSPTQIYSTTQRSWFYNELTNSTAYDYVVWLNTKPWMGNDGDSDDSWSAYPKERQTLSDHITKVVTHQNLFVVSGDAHMVAFDDGTNTHYGTTRNSTSDIQTSFPLLQSGPLDKLGSIKGKGFYSHGCHTFQYERNHQYSTLSFQFPTNPSDPTCIQVHSYSIRSDPIWKQDSLVFHETFCGSLFPSLSSSSSSSLSLSDDSSPILSVGASCTMQPFSIVTLRFIYIALAIFFLNLLLLWKQRFIILKTQSQNQSRCRCNPILSMVILYIVFSIAMVMCAASPFFLKIKALESFLAVIFWIVHGVSTFLYVWLW